MGMTIAEKIIAAAAGVEAVKPGDIHTVEVDQMMSNDGTTHLTIDMYNQKLDNPHIADVKKLVWIATCRRTAPRRLPPTKKCGISPGSMALPTMRARGSATRL